GSRRWCHHGVTERLHRGGLRHRLGLDLDGLARLGIATDASGPVDLGELGESLDDDGLALGDDSGDDVGQAGENRLDVFHVLSGLGGDGANQFSTIHQFPFGARVMEWEQYPGIKRTRNHRLQYGRVNLRSWQRATGADCSPRPDTRLAPCPRDRLMM